MADQLSVLKGRGNTALKNGQIDDAEKYYLLALGAEHATKDSMLRRQIQQNLALCKIKRGAWQECVDICTTLISQGCGDIAKVQYRMGLALAKLGRKLDALGHIEKARHLEPTDKAIEQLLDSVRRIEPNEQTAPVPILALMAVHMSSTARYEHFRSCLKSIEDQTVAPTLAISWSATNEEIASKVRALLEVARPGCCKICLEQPRRLSQFQHYRILTERLAATQSASTPCWVVFSDDDDFWDPQRIEACAHEAGGCDAMSSVQSVVFPWFATRPDGIRPSSVEDIEDGIRKGVVQTKGGLSQEERKGATVQSSEDEYWMYVVRLQVHEKFFEQASDTLLACEFCDMAYKSFVRSFGGIDGGAISICFHPGLPWMYFYHYDETKQTSSSASSSMQDGPTVEDQKAAARLLPNLATIPGCGLDTAEDAAYASALIRRSVALWFCTNYAFFQEPDLPFCESFVNYFSNFMPVRARDKVSTQAVNWFLLVAQPPWSHLQRLGATSDFSSLEQTCKEKAAAAMSTSKLLGLGCQRP